MSKYKIIMTGGGTAGHVTPNLALIPKLKEEGFEIKYIGSKNGIEKEIIAKEKIPYFEISSGKFRRYFDVKNFTDPFKVMKGVFEALSILNKEKPDVIFSKGGFVTVPVVMAASLKKTPVISHESDLTPGLANKLAAPFCDKLCVTFPESIKYVKAGKGVLTGTPIRKELLEGSRLKGKNICNFKDNKKVILVIGGSLGSKVINESVRNCINEILDKFNVIHICGKGNVEKSFVNKEGYVQFEYVSEELPHLMALSDIVISRAGANVIFELLLLKKLNILIPLSKNASRGDQVLNAESFEKAGYSKVIQEENLNTNALIKAINEVIKDESNYINAMKKSEFGDGVSNIIKIILSSIKK